MTLQAKLCEPFGGLRTETVNELEKIADEFAIDFSKWCFKNFDMTTTIEDLLKIYKEKHNL